jgi:hypothetical protein
MGTAGDTHNLPVSFWLVSAALAALFMVHANPFDFVRGERHPPANTESPIDPKNMFAADLLEAAPACDALLVSAVWLEHCQRIGQPPPEGPSGTRV